MAEPTGKTHTLTTIVDLFEVVTVDNAFSLADDLKTVLVSVAMQKEALREADMGEINFAANPSIKWTDDDLRQVTTEAETADGFPIATVMVKPKQANDQSAGE